ncbi:hypothetical protein TNCV_3030121 [Trichonephila clavipes]|nr:hypothetical protein TNCV_3030121 [Trichonephila clavipes]
MVNDVEPILETLLGRTRQLLDCAIIKRACIFGTLWPSSTVDYLLSVIYCCQYRATSILPRSRWWPIRLFDQPAFLRPTIRPLSKSDNCSYCHRFRLRSISSHNSVHANRQICLTYPMARTMVFLNSPSCAFHMRKISQDSKKY